MRSAIAVEPPTSVTLEPSHMEKSEPSHMKSSGPRIVHGSTPTGVIVSSATATLTSVTVTSARGTTNPVWCDTTPKVSVSVLSSYQPRIPTVPVSEIRAAQPSGASNPITQQVFEPQRTWEPEWIFGTMPVADVGQVRRVRQKSRFGTDITVRRYLQTE